MAKYEKVVYGDFDSILEKLNDAVMSGSTSASYEDGSGYIFIQHLAPYGRLQTPTVCRLALKRILSFGGYELPAGQGFHITRKTFATRLLEALNKIDDISNALGHVRKETSEVYLERDEAGMRLCPIRFGSVSVC